MATFFILLFLLALIFLPLNLIRPSIFNKITKRNFSRKQIGLMLSGVIIALFILIGITTPPTTPQQQAQKQEQSTYPNDQSSGQSLGVTDIVQEPSPQPSPTPTPPPSPSPSPTPKPTPSPKLTSPTPQNSPIISTQPKNDCNPSYPDVCIPNGAADYDCTDGSGNGPNYIKGPIRVLPPDPYKLDSNHDGIGCE